MVIAIIVATILINSNSIMIISEIMEVICFWVATIIHHSIISYLEVVVIGLVLIINSYILSKKNICFLYYI